MKYGEFKCNPKVDNESIYLLLEAALCVTTDNDRASFSRGILKTVKHLLNAEEN